MKFQLNTVLLVLAASLGLAAALISVANVFTQREHEAWVDALRNAIAAEREAARETRRSGWINAPGVTAVPPSGGGWVKAEPWEWIEYRPGIFTHLNEDKGLFTIRGQITESATLTVESVEPVDLAAKVEEVEAKVRAARERIEQREGGC